MAKAKEQDSSLWRELFRAGLYKGGQGKVARQITFAALAVAFGLTAWQMYAPLKISPALNNFAMLISGTTAERSVSETIRDLLAYGFPILVLSLGFWCSFRLVNYPKFSDFLIAVEAEMAKVSWPSRGELVRSSMVVIFVIFALAFILAGYDTVWYAVFKWMGITS